MKRFILLLMLAGCNPEPTLKCDYCHVLREGAKRYVCDKCMTPHVACDVDKAIMHYNQTGSGRLGAIYHSATSVLVCPSPEDPKQKEAAADLPKEGTSWGFVAICSILPTLLLIMMIVDSRRKWKRDQAGVE